MLTAQEIRSSTHKELLGELETASRELLKLKMANATKTLKDSSLVSKQKKYVARLKTIKREIDMEEAVKNAKKL